MLVPRACARAVGMGLGVESSGGSGGLPWVFGSSLVVRVSDWPFKGEYSTSVQVWSRGSCHIWEGTPLTTLRDILSPAHPPCFIDISAMLQSNMADMSLPRGRGRKARKSVRGQVLDSSRSLGMTGLRGSGWGGGGKVVVSLSGNDHDGLTARGRHSSTLRRCSG